MMPKHGLISLLFALSLLGCSTESRRLSDWPRQWTPRSDAAMVALGRRLFFDPALSGSGRTACASCHTPDYAYSDPRPVSISDLGRRGERHAPSLINVGLRPSLMWDGRFSSLEEQAYSPFARGEMGIGIAEAAARITDDSGYRRAFVHAFGQPPGDEGIAVALAAFERTLVIRNSRFDRFVIDHDLRALSPLEQHGFDVFTTKGHCVSCHALFAPGVTALPLLSDFQFRNLGIGFRGDGFRDQGRADVTLTDADAGAFRTPSLRNVAATRPYMHDGSLRTLEQVVAFYDGGGRPNPLQSTVLRPLGLSDDEKDGLIAFLYSLTDADVAGRAQ